MYRHLQEQHTKKAWRRIAYLLHCNKILLNFTMIMIAFNYSFVGTC